jgi:hypothetical protein
MVGDQVSVVSGQQSEQGPIPGTRNLNPLHFLRRRDVAIAALSRRRLALPKPVKDWSLRTLRDKLIKIGAKAVSHSRYVIFQMAEVAVPQILFREILEPDPAAAFF